ncbi:MAG: ATP-dependent helicase, partial [Lachnospiraceae bacterium]|nr:ATP-dependent helicase [Lachnospiraceae bacterium]
MSTWDGIQLNEEQKQAVETTEGFVRVIAGAGSGKTRALSHRFAFLVNVLGIMPGHILCVTFTNKAANEMRRRIHRLTGDNDTGYVNTFHGFCVSILQEDSFAVSYPRSFLVLDNSDINAMLSAVYEERGLALRDMTFSKARDMIEMQKLFKKPDYYLDLIDMSLDTLREKYENARRTDDIIFYGYLYQEKKCFGLDYNDLILFCLHIFRTNKEIAAKWQKRLEYIMIDEFQDIDALQYELMEALYGYHGNLFIVGDPDQTVYTWRGADVKYILDFDKEHPGTKTITMMKNYRSTPQILAAANSLIDKNRFRIKKQLVPMRSSGESVLLGHSEKPEEEAQWVVDQMKALREAGEPFRDMTVLYRAHYITRPIEQALQAESIPYRIYSGVRFFDRAEIKTAHSYLRMIAFRDDLDFSRVVNVPRRNIGEKRMRFLREFAEERNLSLYEALRQNVELELFKNTGAASFIRLIESEAQGYEDRPVSELLGEVLQRSGFEQWLRTEGDQERLDNLAELLQSIYEYESSCGEEATLEHYLSHVALFTNSDADDDSDKVKLMTIHAAKGLEFEYVFLCGMN